MFFAIAMWMYGSSRAYTKWPPLCLIEAASANARAVTNSATAATSGHRRFHCDVRFRLTNIYVDSRPINEHANKSAPSDHISVPGSPIALVQPRARRLSDLFTDLFAPHRVRCEDSPHRILRTMNC